MKKTLCVVIFIVYIVSIAFVGFLGAKIVIYNESVIPTGIDCINEDMVDKEEIVYENGVPKLDYDGNPIKRKFKQVILHYVDGLKYQLMVRVYPEQAKQNVSYEFDRTQTKFQLDETTGLITVLKRGIFDIKIVSKEYPTLNVLVRIVVKK